MAESNHALKVAKELQQEDKQDFIITENGYKVKFKMVASSLITEASTRIIDPPVPVTFNEDMGRNEENPHDKEYLATLAKNNLRRGEAITNIAIIFGVELLEEMPDKSEWLGQLELLQKVNGDPKLDEYDLENEIDLKFLYMKYIVLTIGDTNELMGNIGVSSERLAKQDKSFRGDDQRESDTDSDVQE